jgi:hypothetical protein
MKGTPENRERFGGKDMPGMIEALKAEHGLEISLQTLYQWRRDWDWDGRLALSASTHEERMLYKLMGLIEKYERHMGKSDKPDPQAAYAYTNLISAFLNLTGKMPMKGASHEEMQRVAEEILRNDYGIKRKLVSSEGKS